MYAADYMPFNEPKYCWSIEELEGVRISCKTIQSPYLPINEVRATLGRNRVNPDKNSTVGPKWYYRKSDHIWMKERGSKQ